MQIDRVGMGYSFGRAVEKPIRSVSSERASTDRGEDFTD